MKAWKERRRLARIVATKTVDSSVSLLRWSRRLEQSLVFPSKADAQKRRRRSRENADYSEHALQVLSSGSVLVFYRQKLSASMCFTATFTSPEAVDADAACYLRRAW